MRSQLTTATACLIIAAASPVSGDTFGSGANAFTIDFVTIGNPGNVDDSAAAGGAFFSPHGAVSYVYRIGVLEVSQDIISRATNQGMTNVTAGAWSAALPAANLTWYEAAAFVNFLNISTGHQPAYDLTFSGAWSMNLWSPGEAWQIGGENLYRHKDAFYFLPSEDEWFKAGFHANDGVSGNYFDYATGSNTAPTAVAGGTAQGTVVYNPANPPSPADVTSNGGLSPYGTRGQNGNVWEWTESALDGVNNSAVEGRAFRGGDYAGSEFNLRASTRNGFDPASGNSLVGVRVASIPEPDSGLFVLTATAVLLATRGAWRPAASRRRGT
jgi:hypothetical protein